MNSLLPHHHHNSNACPQFTPSSKNTGSSRSCMLRSGCSRYFPSTFAGIGLSPLVGRLAMRTNIWIQSMYYTKCVAMHTSFLQCYAKASIAYFVQPTRTIRTLTRISVLADSEHFRRVLWLVSGTCFSSTDGLSSSLLLWQSCKWDEYNNANNANIFCVFLPMVDVSGVDVLMLDISGTDLLMHVFLRRYKRRKAILATTGAAELMMLIQYVRSHFGSGNGQGWGGFGVTLRSPLLSNNVSGSKLQISRFWKYIVVVVVVHCSWVSTFDRLAVFLRHRSSWTSSINGDKIRNYSNMHKLKVTDQWYLHLPMLWVSKPKKWMRRVTTPPSVQ